MRLLLLGPEIWDGEALVEVRAVVVHYYDWEHDVHAKLIKLVWSRGLGTGDWELGIGREGRKEGKRTLKTSRLGPPILKVLEVELVELDAVF
jgi:hypothetical protein